MKENYGNSKLIRRICICLLLSSNTYIFAQTTDYYNWDNWEDICYCTMNNSYHPSSIVMDSLQNIISKNSVNFGMADAINYTLGKELNTEYLTFIPLCQTGGGENINQRNQNASRFASKDEILIYPNPVNQILSVQCKSNGLSYTKAEISTLYGIKLDSYSIDGNKTLSIGMTELPNGIYILKLSSEIDGKQLSYKIVVNH